MKLEVITSDEIRCVKCAANKAQRLFSMKQITLPLETNAKLVGLLFRANAMSISHSVQVKPSTTGCLTFLGP